MENVTVKVRYGDSFEGQLNKFTKACMKARIIQEYRNREYYISKSEQLRMKKLKAKRKQEKYEQKEQDKQGSRRKEYKIDRRGYRE